MRHLQRLSGEWPSHATSPLCVIPVPEELVTTVNTVWEPWPRELLQKTRDREFSMSPGELGNRKDIIWDVLCITCNNTEKVSCLQHI